ncbi:MAG: MFS transporter [Actinomycetota bacterium]
MPRAVEDQGALRRAWTAVTSAFASHAVLSGLLGPWMPELKERAGLDASGLGVALTGFAVGLLVGTRVAGPAVRRLGGRGVVRSGIVGLGTGFGLLPLAGGLTSLAAIFLGIGLVAGLVDVAMNGEAVAVERRFGRRVMTAIHGTWSVALFVGAGVASLGIAAGIPISVHLPLSAAVIVAASFPLLRWLPRDRHGSAGGESGAQGAHRERAAGIVLLLCVIAAGSFLTEGIAMEWSAVYLREALGAPRGVGGLGVVAFSAGMAATRFVGDRLVGRFGQAAIVRVGAGTAALALATMLLLPSVVGSIGALAVVGLCLGPVVPLAFRSAGSIDRPRGGTALPLVVTAGYVGSIVGPLVVGFLADRFGLRGAFLVPLVAVAAAAIAAGATRDR